MFLETFEKGYFQVQDVSSMLVGLAANPKPGDHVIDICAAPGGKSIHVADLLNGTGHVESRDLTDYKVGLIEENIFRCGFKNVTAKRTDALILDETVKESADIVIVFPHWGDEYKLIHNSVQTKEAKWLAENGADIIIGAHPHVVQDTGHIEVSDTASVSGVKKVPVVYSLGNAISNMSADNTQIELMATLKIVKTREGEIYHLPLEFTYLWSSRPDGHEKNFTILVVKDEIGNSDEWISKWEYDKMVTTYNRVKSTTKVKDN
jgi:23S rRNA U2552 (ribose-2'-O)-methylase RlmE/FtsJ